MVLEVATEAVAVLTRTKGIRTIACTAFSQVRLSLYHSGTDKGAVPRREPCNLTDTQGL
jgi:hypothetical protein